MAAGKPIHIIKCILMTFVLLVSPYEAEDFKSDNIENVTGSANEPITRTPNEMISKQELDRQIITEEYRPEKTPYTVLIRFKYDSGNVIHCIGSLLTAEWALTAGNCIFFEAPSFPKDVLVLAGATGIVSRASDFQSVKYERLIPYPKYATKDVSHNIMLIKTKEKFNITKIVDTIGISLNPWDFQGYQSCIMVGFGKNASETGGAAQMQLKTHHLRVKKPCEFDSDLKKLQNHFICSEEEYGMCEEDSGSGLICDGKLWAIAALLYPHSSCHNCKHGDRSKCPKDTSYVFLDTCPFLEWINGHVEAFDREKIHRECLNFASQLSSSDEEKKSNSGWIVRSSAIILLFVFSLNFVVPSVVSRMK